MTYTASRPRRILGAVSASILATTLVACGSDDVRVTAQTESQDWSQPGDEGTGDGPASGGQGGRPGGQGFPGASGEIVALDGETAQVRSEQAGQVAVSWTDTTAFTTTVEGSLGDIGIGDCVVVMGADEETGAAATSINVSEPVDGSCTGAGPGGMGGMGRGGGPGGPGGEAPDGAPTDLPEGAPTDRPDFDGERLGPGGFVIGEVTEVGGDALTVAAVELAGGGPGSADEAESATEEPSTEERTVSVGAETRITTVVDTDASEIVVGLCVTAQGESDDVGAVTAESIALSEPVDGSCGFGGGRGAGMRPGGGSDS